MMLLALWCSHSLHWFGKQTAQIGGSQRLLLMSCCRCWRRKVCCLNSSIAFMDQSAKICVVIIYRRTLRIQQSIVCRRWCCRHLLNLLWLIHHDTGKDGILRGHVRHKGRALLVKVWSHVQIWTNRVQREHVSRLYHRAGWWEHGRG